MNKKVPTGVKVLSILSFIGGIGFLLIGLAMISGASMISGQLEGFGNIFGGLLVGMGAVTIIVSIILLIGGWGLWKGRNWARWLFIILIVITFIQGMISFVGEGSGLGNIIFGGIIGAYLLLSKKVKKAFA